MNLKIIKLSEGNQIPKSLTLWFHVYEFLEQAKLIYDNRNENRSCLVDRRIVRGGVQRNFMKWWKILYLDRSVAYIGVHIVKTHLIECHRLEHFPVCNYTSHTKKTGVGGTAGITFLWHCSMCFYFPSTVVALWNAIFRMQVIEACATSVKFA